jgi:hypothetical protein
MTTPTCDGVAVREGSWQPPAKHDQRGLSAATGKGVADSGGGLDMAAATKQGR